MTDLSALRAAPADTPPAGMSTPTPESNMPMSRWEKAAATRKAREKEKKRQEVDISGIASGATEPSLEDTRPPLTNNEKRIVKNLAGLYAALGLGVTMVQPLAGAIIMAESANRAIEVIYVARHYPKMMAWLEKFIETNDIATLATGHGVMALALLVAVDRIQLSQGMAQLLSRLGYQELIKIKVGQAGNADDRQEAVAQS